MFFFTSFLLTYTKNTAHNEHITMSKNDPPLSLSFFFCFLLFILLKKNKYLHRYLENFFLTGLHFLWIATFWLMFSNFVLVEKNYVSLLMNNHWSCSIYTRCEHSLKIWLRYTHSHWHTTVILPFLSLSLSFFVSLSHTHTHSLNLTHLSDHQII